MRPVSGEIRCTFSFAREEASTLSYLSWTSSEKDLFVQIIENRESMDDFAICLARTEVALRSKAGKLNLRPRTRSLGKARVSL